MVNCVKGSRQIQQMSTEDLEAALASLRASVTESRAVSVEWPNSEARLVVVQNVVLCKKQREVG